VLTGALLGIGIALMLFVRNRRHHG
jgi:hypothetical protein